MGRRDVRQKNGETRREMEKKWGDKTRDKKIGRQDARWKKNGEMRWETRRETKKKWEDETQDKKNGETRCKK